MKKIILTLLEMAILSALFLPLIFLLKVAYFFVPIILGLGSILVFFFNPLPLVKKY